MTIMKRFEIINFENPIICEQEVQIIKLSHSGRHLNDIFIITNEECIEGEKTFYSSLEEAEERIHIEYEEYGQIKEVDIDDVGFGTLVINEHNKAVFYRYRTGYTWYVKHSSGNVRHPQDPNKVNYESLEEAVKIAKRTYGV